MIAVAEIGKALLNRADPHKNGNSRTQFIGTNRHEQEGEPDRNALAPVAYLVEQRPYSQLRAHFHVRNQFQIFVSGEGRIGPHHAAPGIGHFAGPYTAYGPIVAGDKGLGYMTLRNGWDDGAQYMPDKIERLRPHKFERREFILQPAPPASLAELQALAQPTCKPLVEARADGLAAWSYRLPPGAALAGLDPATGGGQFWLVMAGGIVDQTEGVMESGSLAFVSPEEVPFLVQAGPAGLDVMLLQFPRPETTGLH